jgi:hypothetical protein
MSEELPECPGWCRPPASHPENASARRKMGLERHPGFLVLLRRDHAPIALFRDLARTVFVYA